MLKINQRVSGLRFTSLGGGGTNGETKRPCRFSVHTPLSHWKWNETHEKSASATVLPLINIVHVLSHIVGVHMKRCAHEKIQQSIVLYCNKKQKQKI